MEKFYLTTPLYYSNDKPHIGSAYTTIAADVLARWARAKGKSVYFQTGLDEHGAKMEKAAKMAGFSNPKEFCDRQVGFFKGVWDRLFISYDYFFRTTESRHEAFVKKFLEKLRERGDIYKGEYKGLYCLGCEEFKLPSDLKNGKCPLHNSVPLKIKETNYFFRLSKYQKKLLEVIEKDKLEIQPEERKNEVLSFLKKEKLRDISISREKVQWGIVLPWDKNQSVYVWIDALLNYLSGGEGYWPADLHLIGKDILKFHAIVWPALLLAGSYPLPKKIFAHGFFTIEGKKISKTFGNIIYVEDLLKKWPPDAIRYTLLKELPFGSDGDFKERCLVLRYEADLANNLGNLIQRTAKMIEKYFSMRIKDLRFSEKDLRRFDVSTTSKKVDDYIKDLQFHKALDLIFNLASLANQYIDKEKPWALEKEDQKRIIGNLVIIIKSIAQMILPFLPYTASLISKQFKGPKLKAEKPLFPK